MSSCHHCSNAAVFCVDYRFADITKKFLAGLFETAYFDSYSWPGSAKKIVDSSTQKEYLSNIAVCANLHSADRIVLINHTDCGAYGGKDAFKSIDDEREKLTDDLRKARDVIKESFPSVEVELYLLDTYRGNSFDKIS